MFAVSFVHGYVDPTWQIPHASQPALVVLGEDGGVSMHKFHFPRTPKEFIASDLPIVGEAPLSSTDFLPLPRFGLTGLAATDDSLFAGAWNGIYELDPCSFAPRTFLTNRLTADVHGISASEQGVISTLPPIDGVVRTSTSGEVVEAWQVGRDLSISTLDPLSEPDWRFLGKQMRGPLGHYHFNNVEEVEGRIILTSRNIGAYVAFTPGDRKATLMPIAHMTPVMMHDGVMVEGHHFATSVDGKILIHGAPDDRRLDSFSDQVVNPDLARVGLRSMSEEAIRLDDILGRQTNWCRGLEVTDDRMVVTVDGRYGSGNRFSVVTLDRTGDLVREDPVLWEDVGDPSGLRYVTGFDVAAV